jgi:hypothetical protein
MIHPAYMILLAAVVAAAILYAVKYGFDAGYAARKGDKPPALTLPSLPIVRPKDEWDDAPGPIGPTEERKNRARVLVEED